MVVPHTSRMRARVTRGTGLLGAGILIAAMNISAPAPLEEPVSAPVVDRAERPSRSLPDRLDVQSGVKVSEDADILLPVVSASAEPGPESDPADGDGPICISSPLEPGVFHISSSFGMRINPIIGGEGLHAGVDLAAPLATPIHAVADGLVTYTGAGQAGRSPELVIIEHEVDGIPFSSWYIHMYPHGVFVEAGQQVRAGEEIAEVGSNGFSTGPHLHLEIHTPIGAPSSGGMAVGAFLSMTHEPGIGEDDDPTETDPQSEDDPEDDLDPDDVTTPEEDDEEELQGTSTTPSAGSPTPADEDETSPDDEQDPDQEDAQDSTQDPGEDEEPEPEPDGDNPETDEEPTPPEASDEDEVGDEDEPEAEVDPESGTGSSPDSRSRAPAAQEEDLEEDGEEDGKEAQTLTLEGSDVEITIEDDEGENDHTIGYTVSRTTGFFDLRSLGMVHDPFPFLERFEYGILAPSACFNAEGSTAAD